MKPVHVAAEPVSAYDAKTHLPRLLARAEQGERFVITRHGRPVAQLIPFEAEPSDSVQEAIRTVSVIRRKLARRGMTLSAVLEKGETSRELAHVGHRY